MFTNYGIYMVIYMYVKKITDIKEFVICTLEGHLMGKYRKYACDISGSLFKSVNRKGIRREKLAGELGISVNQLKNYAYDSGKSATLENFLCVLTKYKCVEVLDTIAKEMDCSVYPSAG